MGLLSDLFQPPNVYNTTESNDAHDMGSYTLDGLTASTDTTAIQAIPYGDGIISALARENMYRSTDFSYDLHQSNEASLLPMGNYEELERWKENVGIPVYVVFHRGGRIAGRITEYNTLLFKTEEDAIDYIDANRTCTVMKLYLDAYRWQESLREYDEHEELLAKQVKW